jgi:catechol 2,3-dioxygenase-like lactoylglutathione lyase family enzyme
MEQRVTLITLGVSDYAQAKAFYEGLNGAEIIREPTDTFYGGYTGAFRDLDGHAWEIADNPGFGLDADGNIVLPTRYPALTATGRELVNLQRR